MKSDLQTIKTTRYPDVFVIGQLTAELSYSKDKPEVIMARMRTALIEYYEDQLERSQRLGVALDHLRQTLERLR